MPTFTPSATTDIVVQVGQESTPGAGGGANRKLNATIIEPSDEVTTKIFRAQGHRHSNVVESEMAWTGFTVTGEPDYREILYILENIFGPATPALVATTTNTWQRVYQPALTGKLSPKTWITQFGDVLNVNQYAYGLIHDFGMKFDSEASPSYNGIAGIAQVKSTGATFTATPTDHGIQPMVRSHLNYYVDNTGAGIGTTQITDEILTSELGYKGVYGPRWASNRSYQSFAGHVDLTPKTDAKLSVAEGSFARSLVVGQTYFLRADSLSTVSTGDAGHFFQLTIDMAIKLTKPTKYGDHKGVYMHDFEFQLVEDETWNSALTITSITDLPTL